MPDPADASRFRRRAADLAAVLALLAAGCGSSPPTPTPSPTPTPTPTPGPVSGAYSLQLLPAASCGLPVRTLTFPMEAASAPGARYPGLQVLLVGDRSGVEAELLYGSSSLRGGVGTRDDGALADESVRVWVRAIADGSITRAADGRGEVASGALQGYIALGDPQGDEGSLGTCTASDHSFSLRVR